MSRSRERLIRYLPAALSVLVVGIVVYFIVLKAEFFARVLLVLIGFGAVVLVHEFGHFIVAKLSDIKVEAFSIGFPPVVAGLLRTEKGWRIRILPDIAKRKKTGGEGGWTFTIGKRAKPGETEYRVGLVPFGGYVKMLGQDDVGPAKATDDPRSYVNKPPTTRMAVIAAGVFLNVVSALIIFMTVSQIGIELQPPVVGDVLPGSPAAHAGLESGDEIIGLDGKSYNLEFTSIRMAAALSGRGEPVSMKVKRPDGAIEDVKLVAEKLRGERLRLFGILPALGLTVADVTDRQTLLDETGLTSGDRIKAVNGKEIEHHWQLEQFLSSQFSPKVTVLAERITADGETELVESQIDLGFTYTDVIDPNTESQLQHIYSIVPRLKVTAVAEKSAAGDPDDFLMAGDIIVAAGDVDNPTYYELRQVTKAHEGKPLKMTVLRTDRDGPEKPVDVTVTPRYDSDIKKIVIGISVALDAEHPVVAKTIKTSAGPEPLEVPRGARIMAVDGVEISNFFDVVERIRTNRGQRITIDWRVDDKLAGGLAVDVPDSGDFVTVKPVMPVPFDILKRLYKATGPVDAIRMGCSKTWEFIVLTYATLKSLVAGQVSPKELVGPVGILKMSYDIVATQPLIYYVYFMGLISACIAVFNFLPILPFDGGHFVFLLAERLKGSPVSERIQEFATRVGWIAVLALFLYVTFNDVIRSLLPWML